MNLVFEPEPSPFVQQYAESLADCDYLRPWRLPAALARHAPGPLQRFAGQRDVALGRGLPGYCALELGARAWARGRTDRILHSKFELRRLASAWAARQEATSRATRIIAPSNAARFLFARARGAHKVLLLDLPHLKNLHADLDREQRAHPECQYLGRYRAPDWALVDQEVEIALADEIVVRGRFVFELLIARGVPRSKLRLQPLRATQVQREKRRGGEELHLLLAGLAAARHGSCELLEVLQGRPWLRIHARSGEGSEPAAFLAHPQVIEADASSLCEVDAVLAPSLCESYMVEVATAAASRIPIIATTRAVGAVPRDMVFFELLTGPKNGLGVAIDALYAAARVDLRVPLWSRSHESLAQARRVPSGAELPDLGAAARGPGLTRDRWSAARAEPCPG